MDSTLFTYEQLKNKSVKNSIADLYQNSKNLELRFICLRKVQQMPQKSGLLTIRFLVADWSGSIYCDFTGDFASSVEEGDIIYATNFVANVYKQKLILYQGKLSKAFVLDKYFLEFQEVPNISDIKPSEIEIIE